MTASQAAARPLFAVKCQHSAGPAFFDPTLRHPGRVKLLHRTVQTHQLRSHLAQNAGMTIGLKYG